MNRIAAIDVGTNTALLLIADVHPDGTLHVVHDAERFVRLGEGVDATRLINPAAMERLRVALLDFHTLAEAHGVEAVEIGATSASRDALNQAALIDFVRRETGFSYQVLSGEEEALWTFRGAVSVLPKSIGSCVVIDLGGGSLEVILGDASTGSLTHRNSLQVGAVRITERFFTRLPPPPEDVDRAVAYLTETFATLPLAPGSGLPLIGTAASTTAKLAALNAGVAHIRPGLMMPAADVQAWRKRLLGYTAAEVLALNETALRGRADVFAAGVLILDVFMARFGFDAYRVSPRGLRHGLALRWAATQAS